VLRLDRRNGARPDGVGRALHIGEEASRVDLRVIRAKKVDALRV
jgi:hypothetical protein